VYPVKERILAVPESYIRGLEAHLYTAEETMPRSQPHQQEQANHIHVSIPSVQNDEPASAERLSDECSAERFVQKMKELSSLATIGDQSPDQAINATSPSASRYTYAKLDFDFIRKS
jgi:proline utilization trans-activator